MTPAYRGEPATSQTSLLPTPSKVPSKEFLYAGKAQFVFENLTGVSVTVQVRKARKSDKFYVTTRLQNNGWEYIGELNPTGALVRTYRAVQRHKDADAQGKADLDKQFAVAQFAVKIIMGVKPIPAGYRMEHIGRCGRCGKMLRDAGSIARGIGPECIKRMT